ncbi:MAG TPA: hypothetical protein VGR96_15890 [Acidobacteriaceae bacterium]|nr:hypothetical protein [Acidobacteriaceae bacterium]
MSPQYNRGEVFIPGMWYHPTLGAKFAANEQDAAQLKAMGFADRYIHQEYPKVVKHKRTGEAKVANSLAEHQALGEDWVHAGHEAEPDVSIVDPEAEREKELDALKEQVAMLTKALLTKMGDDAEPEGKSKKK